MPLHDEQSLKDLAAARDRWESSTLKKTLDKMPEGRERFMTQSSVDIDRLYTPLDVSDTDYLRDLGFPGEYPYTRGVHATGHRGKLWTMRMFAGFGTAEETNARYKYLLEQGNMGLSVAFDLATLMGYDTDAPEALGEFGKCGVAVSSLQDMELLFDGIPLGDVSTSMTINSPAAILWAFYIAAAEKQGVPMANLRGTLQNDILKEYIAQKEFIFPPEPSMRLVTDTIEFGAKHLPQWNTISVSGYHIREAGSTAVQELAFTLADGLEYVRWALDRGLDIDAFAPRISFFYNVHNDFFEEIAKLRAARRIWAREMRETFGAKDPRSWLMRYHCQTAGVSLTAQQPEVNLVRVAIQALAAVIGGAQSLHTNSMDEALALPTQKAVQIALRTQQVIAHETGVSDVADPMAGSYTVEYLTDEVERGAVAYIEQIDAMGGALAAIEAGFVNGEIQQAAYDYQRAVESGDQIIVGVNKFAVKDEVQPDLLRVDPAIEQGQRDRLVALRAERDHDKVNALRGRLDSAARTSENLMPLLIECVENDVTLGEICNTLRVVFGEYRPEVSV